MGHELVKLGVEIGVAVVLVAVLVVGSRMLGPRRLRLSAPVLAATALTTLLCLSLVLHVHATASAFSQDHKHSTGARQGLEHCYEESLTGQPLVPGRAPFLDWVKTRLPHDARYAISPYSGPPDAWCVTLALLPALPSLSPRWTVYMGAVPSAVQAEIDRHDPAVQVFATGYALVRNPS